MAVTWHQLFGLCLIVTEPACIFRGHLFLVLGCEGRSYIFSDQGRRMCPHQMSNTTCRVLREKSNNYCGQWPFGCGHTGALFSDSLNKWSICPSGRSRFSPPARQSPPICLCALSFCPVWNGESLSPTNEVCCGRSPNHCFQIDTKWKAADCRRHLFCDPEYVSISYRLAEVRESATRSLCQLGIPFFPP